MNINLTKDQLKIIKDALREHTDVGLWRGDFLNQSAELKKLHGLIVQIFNMWDVLNK